MLTNTVQMLHLILLFSMFALWLSIISYFVKYIITVFAGDPAKH